MIRICVTFILVFLIAGTATSEDRVNLRDGVASTVKQDKKGNRVSVVIRAAVPSPSFPPYGGYRWGSEMRRPESIVTALEISVGKDTVFVPLSAYSDLTNPQSILLETEGRSYRVSILGGDASVAYEAVVVFTK